MKAARDEFCRCHHPAREETLPPLPERRTDGNGKLVAVTCGRCTRIISAVCARCQSWIDRLWDHFELCTGPKATRTKRVVGPWLPGVKE